MSLLDHPEAQALLADAEVSAADVRGCGHRLGRFLRRSLQLAHSLDELSITEGGVAE